MYATSASRPTFAATAIKAAPFFAAGLIGITAGGTLWGLLGVASMLFSVWIMTSALDFVLHTEEIERHYHPSPDFLPAPVPVTQRVTLPERLRSLRVPAVRELESVGS